MCSTLQMNEWMKLIIKSNAADSLAIVICNSELVDMTEDVVKSTLLFDITIKFSKCPISREPTEIKYNGKFCAVTISENLINEIVTKITPSKFIHKLIIEYTK